MEKFDKALSYCASREESRMLACRLDEHRDNLRSSQSVVLMIV